MKKQYEVVREIQNLCKNNQKRDVSIREIETDDPVEWVRRELRGADPVLSVERHANGDLTVFAESAGLSQKFVFSEL